MSKPRIQHVSIPRPPGSAEQTRAFYGEVLGLEEAPIPQSIQHLDVIWYRLGDTELHLFREEPQEDSSGRHLCIEFEDLEGVRKRLTDAGFAPYDTLPIPNRPRFFCKDPFGNTLEFTTILGSYE